jgi:hypothetical protein
MGTSKTAPNTNNYIRGSGVLFFDRLDTSGLSTGELDLGNAPSFSISPTVETIKHYESRTGAKELDLEADKSIEYTVKFILEEYNKDTLDLAFLGDGVNRFLTQAGGSGQVDTITAKQDRWVTLTKRNISSVVVAHGATTFIAGYDYAVDAIGGRIFIYLNGTIASNEALTVTYNYGAINYPKILAAIGSPIAGKLRFVGDCNQGANFEIEMWKVKIKCSSEIPFIGDDWGKLNFEGSVYKDTTAHPTEPFFRCMERKSSTIIS